MTVSELGFARINEYVSGRWAVHNVFASPGRTNVELVRTEELETDQAG
jgi:hypothetical protein